MVVSVVPWRAGTQPDSPEFGPDFVAMVSRMWNVRTVLIERGRAIFECLETGDRLRLGRQWDGSWVFNYLCPAGEGESGDEGEDPGWVRLDVRVVESGEVGELLQRFCASSW